MNRLIINTLVCMQLMLAACNGNAQPNTIIADAFEKGISEKNIQLLDVRTAQEYEAGHLEDALQADWTNSKQFEERIKALDKEEPVYIYCLSGGRSANAMEWMNENGFKKVYNLKGGINSWKQANKKVEGQSQQEQISMQEFESSIPKDKTVLVDIGAKWCPPCKKMQPILDSLIKQNYNVIQIDGGAQTELCKQLNADAFPLFIVYKNGKEINRKQGMATEEELKKMLE
jgi:rhodanese-related sulfurtransferase